MWRLDPTTTHVNHGSFGAVPRPVRAEQDRLRSLLDANPTAFVVRELEPRLDRAREALAGFLDADPDALAFVDNATTGVNTVLAMFERRLGPSDEVVVTDHEYNACRNALDALAGRTGCTVRIATLPFPVTDPTQVVGSIVDRLSPATKLVMIDHVTSSTAMVLPVGEVIAAVAPVPVLVDGAHGPGMVDVSLSDLGASFYVGNCHKWMCAPHGAAVLAVDAAYRGEIDPLVVSHGWNDVRRDRSRYRRLFDVTGTRDVTPALCVPTAIETIGATAADGWAQVRADNRTLALAGRAVVADRLGLPLPVPASMIGSMASLVLPAAPSVSPGTIDPLAGAVGESHGVEVPVFAFPTSPARVVRLSAFVYNRIEDYERLAAALAHHLR